MQITSDDKREHDIAVLAGFIGRVLDRLELQWKDDPSMRDTPTRVAKYLLEYRQPLDRSGVFTTFEVQKGYHEIISQTNIPFRMVCEHHLLPAWGRAHLGYIPNTRVLGLSKMVRLVNAVGHERPSLQEHIGSRIVDLMEEHLDPQGVALVIQAEHGCVACRGTKSPDVVTTTSHIRGVFRDNIPARQEFMSLINMRLP